MEIFSSNIYHHHLYINIRVSSHMTFRRIERSTEYVRSSQGEDGDLQQQQEKMEIFSSERRIWRSRSSAATGEVLVSVGADVVTRRRWRSSAATEEDGDLTGMIFPELKVKSEPCRMTFYYVCDACGKSYIIAQLFYCIMFAHTHTGEELCLYDFRSQSYIKAWQVMYYVYQGGNHSGETTFMCDDCGKFLLLCRRGNYEQMKNDHVFI